MVNIIVKNYDTEEEISRIKVKKLESLFDLQAVLNQETKELFGGTVIDTGIHSYSTKNGVMDSGSRSNSDAVYTGRGSWVAGVGADKYQKEPDKVKILTADGEKELDIRLHVIAYPEGFVLRCGKTHTNILGSRNEMYLKNIGKKNFCCSPIDSCHIFPSLKSMLSYIKKHFSALEYMVSDYSYHFSIETACEEYQVIKPEEMRKSEKQAYEDILKLLERINESEAEDLPIPESVTEADCIAEAISRLERFHVTEKVISSFRKGKLFMSEFSGILYDLNENAQKAVSAVREKGFFPYAVVRTQMEIGDCYAVLYVSKQSSEWDAERPSSKGYCLCYVYNASDPKCSELGTCQFEGANGGIMRTQ